MNPCRIKCHTVLSLKWQTGSLGDPHDKFVYCWNTNSMKLFMGNILPPVRMMLKGVSATVKSRMVLISHWTYFNFLHCLIKEWLSEKKTALCINLRSVCVTFTDLYLLIYSYFSMTNIENKVLINSFYNSSSSSAAINPTCWFEYLNCFYIKLI